MIEALQTHGVTPAWVSRERGYGIESGYRACREILEQAPGTTCIMASNDLAAIGVMNAARDMGLAVPQRLSVTGADGLELHGQVPLTTYASASYTIGKTAARLLQDVVENPEREPERLRMPVTFIAGQTVAPCQPDDAVVPCRPMRKQNRGRKEPGMGFTLVELLVIITIVSVLAAAMLPMLERTVGMARQSTCANNVKTIGIGIQLYANSANDFFPTMERNKTNPGLIDVTVFQKNCEAFSGDCHVNMYAVRPESFRCPVWGGVWPATFTDNSQFAAVAPYGVNAYFSQEGMPKRRYRLSSAKYPAECMMYGDKLGGRYYSWMLFGEGFDTYGMFGVRHDGYGNACYVDGHVTAVRGYEANDPTSVLIETQDGKSIGTVAGGLGWFAIGLSHKSIARFWGMDATR